MRWPRTRWTRMSVATCICLCSIASSRLIGLTSRRHFTASYGTPRRLEDVVVEVVLAEQQLVHVLQEHARTRRPG